MQGRKGSYTVREANSSRRGERSRKIAFLNLMKGKRLFRNVVLEKRLKAKESVQNYNYTYCN
jgi:hypothetical protein